MTTMMASPKSVPGNEPVATQDILGVAAQYFRSRHATLDPGVLGAAQEEIRQRIAEARSWGFTQRDVIVALLRTLVSRDAHCGCPSCRARCMVCAATRS